MWAYEGFRVQGLGFRRSRTCKEATSSANTTRPSLQNLLQVDLNSRASLSRRIEPRAAPCQVQGIEPLNTARGS